MTSTTQTAAQQDRHSGSTLAALTGGLFGAGLAFLLAFLLLPPTNDGLRAAAEELVPDAATITSLGHNSGHPVIVGWDRFAVADFEDDDTSWRDLHAALLEKARANGWSVTNNVMGSFWARAEMTNGLMDARSRVYGRMEEGERIDPGAGVIRTDTNEARRSVLFWTVVIAGAVAGGGLATKLS